MNYRKATTKDIKYIAQLVTDLLGTCNLDSDKTSIFQNNVDDISKTIDNYYVCVEDDKVIGACGISDIQKQDDYNLKQKNIREILYLVVDNKYQRRGIGTKLLELCSSNNQNDIIYEAWGDNGEYVNSKFILERCGYILLKDLGRHYYKEHNYCPKCVNRNKECNECIAQIWIKYSER